MLPTGTCDDFRAALNHRPPLPSGVIFLSWAPDGTATLVQLVPSKCSNCCFGPPPGAAVTHTSVSDSVTTRRNCIVYD